MKIHRSSLIPVLIIAVAGLLSAPAFADDAAAPPADAAGKSDERVQKALDKWKETLKLTDEQTPKFNDIMRDSHTKMAEAKEAAAGDKVKLKASMQSIFKERDEALSKILTADQMKIYREKIAKAANKMKNHKKGKHAHG